MVSFWAIFFDNFRYDLLLSWLVLRNSFKRNSNFFFRASAHTHTHTHKKTEKLRFDLCLIKRGHLHFWSAFPEMFASFRCHYSRNNYFLLPVQSHRQSPVVECISWSPLDRLGLQIERRKIKYKKKHECSCKNNPWVECWVTWLLSRREAEGDHVLINYSVFLL